MEKSRKRSLSYAVRKTERNLLLALLVVACYLSYEVDVLSDRLFPLFAIVAGINEPSQPKRTTFQTLNVQKHLPR